MTTLKVKTFAPSCDATRGNTGANCSPASRAESFESCRSPGNTHGCSIVLAAALAGTLNLTSPLIAQAVPAGRGQTAESTPATDLDVSHAPATDPWRFDFALIGWGPSVTGSTGIAGHQVNADVSLDTILGDLKGIAMFGLELRKEKFGFYAQPNWIKLQADGNLGRIQTQDDLELWIVDAAGFYQLGKWGQEKPVTLDALVGVRYWNVSDDLTLRGPGGLVNYHTSDTTYLVDPILGLRTQIYLARKLSLSLHGDVGGFDISNQSSQLTWQALGMLGYDFTRHFSLGIGYRALSTDKPDGKSLDLLLHGAFLALDFHW